MPLIAVNIALPESTIVTILMATTGKIGISALTGIVKNYYSCYKEYNNAAKYYKRAKKYAK